MENLQPVKQQPLERKARAKCPRAPHEVINELAYTSHFDEMKPSLVMYHRFPPSQPQYLSGV
jgi:hypothetical protein